MSMKNIERQKQKKHGQSLIVHNKIICCWLWLVMFNLQYLYIIATIIVSIYPWFFFSVFEPNLEPPNQPPWHWPCWSAPCAQWVFPPIPKTQRKKMSICNGLVGKINLKPWFWPPVVWGSDSPLQSWDDIQIIQIQNIISVYISMALCLCNKPEKKQKPWNTHTRFCFTNQNQGLPVKLCFVMGLSAHDHICLYLNAGRTWSVCLPSLSIADTPQDCRVHSGRLQFTKCKTWKSKIHLYAN
jgi:hypothetical protein